MADNSGMIRSRLDALERQARSNNYDFISSISRDLAESARAHLDDIPVEGDLYTESGAAALRDWTYRQTGGKAERWKAASDLLRHALLVQNTPERALDFMRGIREPSVSLMYFAVHRNRSASGGAKKKRREWADVLAEQLRGQHREVAWRSITDTARMPIHLDDETVEVFRDGDRVYAEFEDGNGDSLSRSTFFNQYLRKKS